MTSLVVTCAVIGFTPTGAPASTTSPDDAKIAPCADFAPMMPGRYRTTTAYDPSNPFQPGSSFNQGTKTETFAFTANLWSDVNADVDNAGNQACGAVAYSLVLYAADPISNTPTGPALSRTTYLSDQSATAQTTFVFTDTWCDSGCTFTGSPPSALAYYVSAVTVDKRGRWQTLDRAPESTDAAPYAISNLDGSGGQSFQ